MEMQTAALAHVPRPSLLAYARYLGLWDGRQPAVPHEAAAVLLYDLGLYAAAGRLPRGIDRYAAHLRPAPEPGSDRARLLAALRASRLSLFKVRDLHPEGGVVLEEMDAPAPVRLMDETLALVARPGLPFAARVAEADPQFAVTCGVLIPASAALFDAMKALPPPPDLGPEAEFAARLHRAALELGVVHGGA
ncbi:hypothetical protein [Caldovatus aquaticus]|uniref:Uncharacterized protein n=1 Tax=Caldovatus aquaticus TaxID=2865671 RepID=A0ABS7F019_9PROT|nr:hypothetical protein [Caldovatus aquaticus]MBW8268985.1 hypothetical protein [Caldovatus aquaticus]